MRKRRTTTALLAAASFFSFDEMSSVDAERCEAFRGLRLGFFSFKMKQASYSSHRGWEKTPKKGQHARRETGKETMGASTPTAAASPFDDV